MAEIVAACLSQFHGEEDKFELLLAHADGREVGHEISRAAVLRVANELSDAVAIEATTPWRSMETAPTDGKHVILAIKSGAFVYAIQGAYMNRKWMNAADIDGEPLCWMPNIMIPDEFLPWTDAYKVLTAAEARPRRPASTSQSSPSISTSPRRSGPFCSRSSSSAGSF